MTTTTPARTLPLLPRDTPAISRPAAAFLDQLVRSYLLDPAAVKAFLAKAGERISDFADSHRFCPETSTD